MKVLKPDFTRRIALPGVPQPVPRPVDIDSALTGFTALRTLRIYRFEAASVIEGHAEEDEVLIIVLEGTIDLTMRAARQPEVDFRLTAPAPGAASVAYLPVHGEYRLTARSAADVAYLRATPAGPGRSPAAFDVQAARAADGILGTVLTVGAHAERLRLQIFAGEAGAAGARCVPCPQGALAGGTLLHLRLAGAGAAARIEGAVEPLQSWDTVALERGERPVLSVAPGAFVLGVLSWAE